MKTLLTFLCIGFFYSANCQHIMVYDSYNPNDSKVEEVFDTRNLEICQKYAVTVEGTYSIWSRSYWSSPCGLIETKPIFASPTGQKTGNVGFDMEYIYSLPNASSCSGKSFPYKTDRIEISLDSGATWFHPTTKTSYNTSHTYIYEVTGKGFPIAVRHVSGLNSDDYGMLKFTFNKIGSRPNIGMDTTICEGDSVNFFAAIGNATYLWQDGSTDSSTTATDSGLYWLEVTTTGCKFRDSFSVSFHNEPKVFLGNDTTLCDGDTLLLASNSPSASVLWQDGSTDITHEVNSSGSYHVVTTGVQCTFRDTINVTYINPVAFDLGVDTILCKGDTLLLHTKNGSSQTLWHDGSTDSVFYATAEGDHWVTIQVGNCFLSDTISVTIIETPVIDFGADTFLCDGQTLQFDFSIPNAKFLWHDGTSDSFYVVSQPGLYWVSVSINNCSTTDTIPVDLKQKPSINLPKDTIICTGSSIVLNVMVNDATYNWNSGQSSHHELTVDTEGLQHVDVSNPCGSVEDSVYISTKNCTCDAFLPNVFTPNKDNLNDVFRPVIMCSVTDYNFSVYNRWGELIFNTSNPAMAWDGTVNENMAPNGVYFCHVILVSCEIC